MYIPKTMTRKIANTFYDKSVQILDKNFVLDDEGGIINNGFNEIDTFKGNVSFSNCKKIQEEYGLDYKIDISITASNDTNICIANYIKYQDIFYDITDILPSDSHILIVAKKWQK